MIKSNYPERTRQKIEDDRAAPVYIRTISNLGYQFMPTVSAESVEKDSWITIKAILKGQFRPWVWLLSL